MNITIVISTVTFIIGLVVGHWLAIFRDKRKEFNAAAEKFRSAFLQTDQLLRAGREDVYKIVTPDVIEQQERALIEFEHFLSETKRVGLNAAWSKYKNKPHTTSPGSLDSRPSDISIARANIGAVLKHAKQR